MLLLSRLASEKERRVVCRAIWARIVASACPVWIFLDHLESTHVSDSIFSGISIPWEVVLYVKRVSNVVSELTMTASALVPPAPAIFFGRDLPPRIK